MLPVAVNDPRVPLCTLNPYVSCYLCKGYLIDAATITECLHTFCKSCIIKHLQSDVSENKCPKCEVAIHRSNPFHGIRLDRTLQDIVYKIVPDLQQKETLREQIFCEMKSIPYKKDLVSHSVGSEDDGNQRVTVGAMQEDRVCIQLETKTSELEPLTRKYICCSSLTTINHVRKLIAKKLFSDLEKYCSVDILCNDEILGKDHTLKFIYITRWRSKNPPLMLYYQPRVDFMQLSQQ